MEPARDLAASRVPVAVIAAERDTLIPPERAEALASAVPNLLFARTIGDAGHNDIYDHPQFRRAVAEAMQEIEES
jgi:pimeloyl-ACP methyl ester carboxylesterase